MKRKTKTHKLTLTFDNKESAEQYRAYLIDGGGDGGGNLDFNIVKWNNDCTDIRIKGTGYSYIQRGNDMVLLTPEVEEELFRNLE